MFNNHFFSINSQKIHLINSKLNAYLQNSNLQCNQIISFQPVSDGYVLVKESQLMFLETQFSFIHAQLQLGLEDSFFNPFLPVFVFSLLSSS